MTQRSPEGSEARDRKAKRDALVAHAVKLTSGQEEGWHRISLGRYLAKAHKLSEKVVLAVIDDAPELESVGFNVRPRRRRRPPPDSTPTPRHSRTWATVTNELVYFLSELQTDTVHVQVAGSRGGVVLRMRLDFVQDGARPTIWTACLVQGERLHQELLSERPAALAPGWFLPLVEPESPAVLPEVLVWRSPTPNAATEVVTTCLQQRLGLPVDRVRVHRDTCTPHELDLRIGGDAARRGLRESAGRRGFAVRSCDRCGQPLTDSVSIQFGIGPECRKYYSREVLAARHRPARALPRRDTSPQATWLTTLKDAWKADRLFGS